MSITSQLFKLARLSADLRSVSRSVDSGSPKPIICRLVNKAIGRLFVSKMFWRK